MAEWYKALIYLAWSGVGSNPTGDIYFHFAFFAPSPFRTGQWSPCKWNQAWQFTRSHSCFDTSSDLSYKALYIYSRSVALSGVWVEVSILYNNAQCQSSCSDFLICNIFHWIGKLSVCGSVVLARPSQRWIQSWTTFDSEEFLWNTFECLRQTSTYRMIF